MSKLSGQSNLGKKERVGHGDREGMMGWVVGRLPGAFRTIGRIL